MENTNLIYAIDVHPDKGNVRETFLLNQFINTGKDVLAPVSGDFFTSGLTIEVGGKSKFSKRVKDAKSFIVAADDIETGCGTKIPLWLFILKSTNKYMIDGSSINCNTEACTTSKDGKSGNQL